VCVCICVSMHAYVCTACIDASSDPEMHVCVGTVTCEGEVYAWGRNNCGQLGLTQTQKCVYDPTLVQFVAGVCMCM
jgi:alpha-tubulin suppressor-like RCC1 family protein